MDMDKSLTELTYREIKKHGVYFSHYGSRDIRNVKPLPLYLDTLILHGFGMRRICQKKIRLMFVDISNFSRDFALY